MWVIFLLIFSKRFTNSKEQKVTNEVTKVIKNIKTSKTLGPDGSLK